MITLHWTVLVVGVVWLIYLIFAAWLFRTWENGDYGIDGVSPAGLVLGFFAALFVTLALGGIYWF